MVDTKQLRAIIYLKGFKMSDVAAHLGITASAFYRKMNGRSRFSLKECGLLIELLDIENSIDIFFKKEVS